MDMIDELKAFRGNLPDDPRLELDVIDRYHTILRKHRELTPERVVLRVGRQKVFTPVNSNDYDMRIPRGLLIAKIDEVCAELSSPRPS